MNTILLVDVYFDILLWTFESCCAGEGWVQTHAGPALSKICYTLSVHLDIV